MYLLKKSIWWFLKLIFTYIIQNSKRMSQEKGIRVAVVGSRTFNNYNLLESVLNKIRSETSIECIVSGGAKGADKLSERWAEEYGVPTKIYKPDWKKFRGRAGIIRNKDIVDDADLVIAFWDGISNGTASTIDIAKKQGKDPIVINF